MNSTEANSEALSDPTEREKWEKEIEIKERELNFKEIELELKKQEHAAASGWKNPLVVAIMATAVAALGNAVVTMTNGTLQRELEDQKSEQARIQEMIKTGDPDKAAENLKFLLEAGLISKPEIVTKLGVFLKNRQPGSGPTLPSAEDATTRKTITQIGIPKSRLPAVINEYKYEGATDIKTVQQPDGDYNVTATFKK